METKEELKGLIKETMGAELKTAFEEKQKKDDEWQKAFSEQSAQTQREIKERIEAIEKLPIVKKRVPIPGTNETTDIKFGFKVDRQFDEVSGNKIVLANPHAFKILSDAEKKQVYGEHLAMIIKACMKDSHAERQYHEWRSKAALAEGAGATGGYTVSTEFGDEIAAFARYSSFGLQECKVVPMGKQIMYFAAEDAKPTAVWTAEATALTAGDPTFAQVTLTAQKLGLYTIASNELLEDSDYDVASWLTEVFAESIGQELDNKILNGTGSPVSGVLTAAAGFSVVMATGETNFSSITGQHLLDMIDKIPLNAEEGCKFVFNKNTLTVLRKLRDTTNQYVFAPMANGLPSDLWGYPYIRSNKAPAQSATAVSTAFAVFGNFKHFLIGRRRGDMKLSVDPYGKFLEGQTRFKMETRWGLAIQLANAFCRLVTAAA